MRIVIYFSLVLSMVSCNSNLTEIYYNNNNSDDGDIFGTNLIGFFNGEKNISTFKIKNKVLHNLLLTCRDSINISSTSQLIDDGYYNYAFVLNKNDTIYADYRLEYWRYKTNSKVYRNERLISLARKIVEK